MSRVKTLSLDPASPSIQVLSRTSLLSSLSPLRAGVETVFQGHGESMDSCLDSPPPSPSSSPELEQHLKSMFSSCDPCRNGLVPVGQLVEYLSSLVDFQDGKRWKVEQLRRMLDTTGENKGVDQDMFMSVGRDWVERVVSKEEDGAQEQMCSEEEQNVLKYQKERELKHQMERLGEEHSELLRTVAGTDELVNTLTKELGMSKNKSASLAIEMEKSVTALQEMEEMNIMMGRLKNEKNILTSKQEQLLMEMNRKHMQLDEFSTLLTNLKKEIEKIKEEKINVQAELKEKNKLIENIMKELEQSQLQLESEMSKNESMKIELEVIRQQLDQLSPGVVAVDNKSCDSERNSSEVNTEDTVEHLQSSVTQVSYTPASATFDQVKLGFGSIMEEIEEVVLKDSLPSPICRKKKIRKMSASSEGMKNSIVDMVRSKVNDSFWLQQFDTEMKVGIAAVLEVERERFEEENSAMDEKFAFMDTHLVLYRLGWTFVILLFPLLIFTFLGGLEIEYNLYYPFTWHMLRMVVGDGLPGPAVMVQLNTWPTVGVY